MNDTTVIVTLTLILMCHLATSIIGYKTKKTLIFISYLNAIVVMSIFLFWGLDTLNVKYDKVECSVWVLLALEACLLISAIYAIIGAHVKSYIKVINYVGFAAHVLAITGLLYYVLAFKFNKLY